MRKVVGAFVLGVVSFVLFMVLGEGVGLLPAFCALAVYFFVSQFLLSRGHRGAWRDDWRVMLALVAVPLVVVGLMAAVEKPDVLRAQGVGLLLASLGGTLLGAFAASLSARRPAS